MKQDESVKNYVVPSNKFYPPHIDHSQSLQRTNLLKTKLPGRNHNKKAVIIEAQAGQGKTTLASQFLEYNDATSIWYQIGPEDSDPVFLLSSLLMNLKGNLPEFSSDQLETILTKGSVGPLDLTRCANILLQDLDNYLNEDIYLVFDDLHFIEFRALTNNLLEYLLDTSPPRIHFVFLTRHPLDIKGKTIRNGSQICYLNTADLALCNKDIETLYTTILEKDINHKDARRIEEVTNGWIMGIILASHPISGRGNFWHNSPAGPLDFASRTGHMLDYFQDEIFDQIPEHLHAPFLKLSFLQEIPADLAEEVTGVARFDRILSSMTQENYFIYRLDDSHHVFRFHHFFQEFLQQRANTIFSKQEIAQIYNQEASYFLDRNLIEKALTCYKNSGEYGKMEDILRTKGMTLIAKNRTLTILTLLESIPEDILFQHSWLILYSGLMRVDFTPQTTLIYWDNARVHFSKNGEETGELIALSQTIYYHFVISGEYKRGAELLPRTTALLEKNRDSLPIEILVMAARNLASGYCFFNGEMEKARHYITMACRLGTRHDIQNFIASTRFIQGYIELLSGNRARYLREAEVCFTLFNNPLVSESNRLTMRVMNLCYLSMTGDHHNYNVQQLALQRSIDHTVVDQTVAAPYLYIWASSNLYSKGMTEDALLLLEKGYGITTTASSDHMHSQLIQWQAFGLALTGDEKEAIRKIKKSLRLRTQAGGPFYTSFHHLIASAVYTRVEEFGKAQQAVETGLEIAKQIPSTYLTICALFNASYLKYMSDGPETALNDLEAGLSLMKINGYDHFWTWEPQMMTRLLGLAVKRDIEKSFAQSLARERLHMNFANNGEQIPLLKFSVMDTFGISMAGEPLFQSKSLSPFQRNLLGLLVTAKGQQIPQEKVQLELWPDKPPVKARKSFDTLVSRLRKTLADDLQLPVKNYLTIEKGILCLNNCEIDALQFIEFARTGLAHSRNSDWWQARNAFQKALILWKRALPEDTLQSEQALTFNDFLVDLLVEMGLTWTKNLADTGKIEEATALLERFLQINSLEELLVMQLYKYYVAGNTPLKAKEILERYRKALLKAEYTEAEITEFIDEIISENSS
ncbi:MAG: BTAD domain-containing putative transcriptional regulator [Desulforhopalus sp.]